MFVNFLCRNSLLVFYRIAAPKNLAASIYLFLFMVPTTILFLEKRNMYARLFLLYTATWNHSLLFVSLMFKV